MKRRAKRGVERGGWQCPIPSSRSAPSQSQKARRIEETVIRSCKATREARSGARRMTVHHSYLRRAFSRKRARRIIVTVIFRCKITRVARGGTRKMTVYNGISVSCLVLDEAMIINWTWSSLRISLNAENGYGYKQKRIQITHWTSYLVILDMHGQF